MKFEESLDTGIINNWISSMLHDINASNSNHLKSPSGLSNGPSSSKSNSIKMQYPVNDEMVKYQE